MPIYSQIVSLPELAKDRLSSIPRNSRSSLRLGCASLSRSKVKKPLGLFDRYCHQLRADLGISTIQNNTSPSRINYQFQVRTVSTSNGPPSVNF